MLVIVIGSWPMPKKPDLFTSIDRHPAASQSSGTKRFGHSTTTTSENFVLFALEWVHTVLAPEDEVRIHGRDLIREDHGYRIVLCVQYRIKIFMSDEGGENRQSRTLQNDQNHNDDKR